MDSSPHVGPPSTTDFAIVGIGASAGGLESIERLFRALPSAPGLAFVVIQHLSPDHKSVMDELMSRYTDLTVRRAHHEEPILSDHVYLLPPGKELEVENGRLLLFERSASAGLSLPIDRFLSALAKDVGDRAIAVILSGTGSDGSRGARRVREAGGVVLVEDPESARFDGMPQAAINSDVADLVMAPEGLATALAGRAFRQNIEERVPPDHLGQIFGLLRAAFGIDFAQYKVSTVLRRIQRRVDMRRMDTLRSYTERLHGDPAELSALGHDLLIGVTEFFRDPETWELMRAQVLPQLVREANAESGLRVWVIGCASGEEAYSLAMLISEEVRRSRPDLNFKLFASDVHRGALDRAGHGIYDEGALEKVAPELRESYFVTRSDGSYQIHPSIRQAVIFAHHNILRNAPFTHIDLITCRNMLIYLRPTAQEYVFSMLSYGLNVGGFLLLGPSETLARKSPSDFDPIDEGHRLYRKTRSSKRLPLLPVNRQPRSSLDGGAGIERSEQKLLPFYDAVLDHVMPLSFLLNEERDLLDCFGGSERLLQLRRRRPSNDFLDLIPQQVRTAVSGALARATRQQEAVAFRGLHWNEEVFDLSINAISTQERSHAYLVQLRKRELSQRPNTLPEALATDDLAAERLADLERELRQTQENLQATVEELETSNEEMQATNEELIAANEELQSSNEELQSVNEELHTVNAEHQAKILEVSRINRDISLLLESIGEAVVLLDGELLIRRFTALAATLFGLIDHDLGRPLSSFRHPLNYPDLLDDLARCRDSRESHERYVTSTHGNHYLIRIGAYQAAEEGSSGVVLTLTDLSALREAQERVELLSKVVSASRDAVIVLSPQGRVIVWNNAAEALYGYSASDIIGSPFEALIPAEQRADFDRAKEHVPGGNRFMSREVLRLHQDGRTLDVSSTLSSIHDAEQQVIAYSVIDRDISERKARERALCERERLLDDMFNHSPDMLVSTDAHTGLLLEYNATFLKQLGYSAEQAAHLHFTQLYTEDSQELARRYMNVFRAEGQLRDVELEMRRKDGSAFEVALSSTAIRSATGTVERSRTVIRDISDRKQAERQLAAASQMREHFLAMVSHELRTPLHAIRSAADVLNDADTDAEVRDQALLIVRRQSAQMTRLLDDLLDVARITANKLELERVPCDLRDAVSDAVDAVRVRFDEQRVGLSWEPPAEPLSLLGDPARLQQVFTNLLNNSLRHCQPGGQVTIRSEHGARRCHISVTDDGEGIAREQLESIFELFAQAPQSIARELRGLGLGLSISQRIVAAHGGTLVARSEGKGHGATLVTTLPLDPTARRKVSSHPNRSSLSIVLVEDQDDSRTMLQFVLERRGHQVTSAHDGKSGVEAILRERPDVALVDIGLPGMNGFEVAKSVRKELGGTVRLVALTGYGQPTDISRSSESGFDRHVTKPLAPDKLELILRELMGG